MNSFLTRNTTSCAPANVSRALVAGSGWGVVWTAETRPGNFARRRFVRRFSRVVVELHTSRVRHCFAHAHGALKYYNYYGRYKRWPRSPLETEIAKSIGRRTTMCACLFCFSTGRDSIMPHKRSRVVCAPGPAGFRVFIYIPAPLPLPRPRRPVLCVPTTRAAAERPRPETVAGQRCE